ncbi:transporter [Propionigenium maris DSM 9537]|uniref:Transporter n=1 Tax=Propionigenium maris DSM 9537 TaxID=1123000 RepID=A0A9W6GMI1_9FUSO|nr:DUF502 domain-containing protein [Propionigenium maris]GLI57022.1 transporter [Propionigenium maris DSM 9537]
MKSRMKNWFYTGLIAVLPVVLTIYFVSWVAKLVITFIGNSFVVKYITDYLLKMESITTRQEAEVYIKITVYVLAVIGVFIGVTIVGMTLKLVIGRKIANSLEKLFTRIPIIKSVYTTLSQITGLVSSDKSKSYQKVVLLEYPRKGIYSLGFLTSDGNEYFEDITGRPKLLNVFIPTSPNPTSGMFVMVQESEARVLDMKVEEAVKLIISGGAVLPETAEK